MTHRLTYCPTHDHAPATDPLARRFAQVSCLSSVVGITICAACWFASPYMKPVVIPLVLLSVGAALLAAALAVAAALERPLQRWTLWAIGLVIGYWLGGLTLFVLATTRYFAS